MIILGIDPGIAIVGYGVIECKGNRFKALDYGAITTEANIPFTERIRIIYDDMTTLIDKYNPTDLAIEELFFNKNVKTALLVGQARGVAILAAANNNRKLYEYTPLQVKQGELII